MSDILEKIVTNTRIEVAARKKEIAVSQLEKSPLFSRTPLDVKAHLLDDAKHGIIAEYKKQSPSKGVINDRVSPQDVAKGYTEAGASVMSVLTDSQFFGGSMEDLKAARAATDIPILRKDFIIDDYQLIEARAIGADMILLIAACLTPSQVADLAKKAKTLRLHVLLEVHNSEELDRSLCDEIDIVGVNNRNLKTFDVSIDTSLELVNQIPDQFVKISESGISDPKSIVQLKKAGFDGFLIGESFMKHDDPGASLREFIQQIKA